MGLGHIGQNSHLCKSPGIADVRLNDVYQTEFQNVLELPSREQSFSQCNWSLKVPPHASQCLRILAGNRLLDPKGT